ncbi:Multi antimicrobial extrusion protein [Roseibacterium elongatum DSM 19469]|uniref:Multi antimicrobial extrusion protein n=1 Tax=Roseicyclus elongatus DSM 19469 TaxID=1294273 RepID=W8RUZ8_9RHOB|nr:MATE family efflux transporter [Roseibacterium elongatum]AHM05083.1 Multi antimicrobial extrusion protein [Roseibacterium elongatum DSM 19469]
MSDAAPDTLTRTPVARALLKISAPMSLGILGVLLIGLADAYFLARVGEAELAAIGFVYPVIVAVSAFSIGMSAGANTALSQAIGREAPRPHVARMTFYATGFGAALGCAIAALLALSAPWLFAALGARGAVLDAVLAYIPWWAASFPILVVTMILNAAFRAAGDGATPSAMMVLTAVLNIALTPLFVFGWGPIAAFGMAGAGIATLIARAIAGAVVLALAIRRGRLSAARCEGPSLRASIAEMTSVGLPAALSRAINPAGMALVTAAVATVGDQAVAGFGAAARVQSVTLVPFFALSAGLAPIVGQAWGAELPDRAREAVRIGTWFAVAYGLIAGLALWVFAMPLAQLMTDSGTAAEFTAQYLGIVGWSLAGYGLVIAANAALTARSRAAWALGLSLTRIGLFYVPLAWLGVSLFGYAGILAAAVIANAMGAWLALSATQVNDLTRARWRFLTAPAAAMQRLSRPRHG